MRSEGGEVKSQRELDLFKKVKDHMGWTDAKTTAWFETENPMFGRRSPTDLIQRGRIHKVEAFVEGCIDDDTPPK